MELVVYSYTDDDFYDRQKLYINGKEVQYVGPLCECPEDAIIGRDLVSCADIVHYMQQAVTAVTDGETVTYQFVTLSEDEWDAL